MLHDADANDEGMIGQDNECNVFLNAVGLVASSSIALHCTF